MFKKSLFLATLFAGLTTNLVNAQVTLGQSAALSGPTKALGNGMSQGANAYFKGNSNVEIKLLDDKYEPKRCVKNTNKHISDNVTALFGYVGTPTSKACVPLAMKAKKIFFGPFTGAGFLADSEKNPYSFSVRASYDMETENMVKMLTAAGKKKIAIFVQDDGFGEVGKSGVLKALKKRGLSLAGEGRYKRNTIAVKGGVDKVIKSGADAVITVGAYRPCGTAIKYMKKKGFNVPVINISFVGSKALSKMLKGNSKNVYVSQVVPNPWDKSIPIVKEYQSKIGANVGFVSFEGYITAKIFDVALKKMNYKVSSSDALRSELRKINTDIGGIKASFSSSKHRALSDTYMTKINSDGSFSYVNKID